MRGTNEKITEDQELRHQHPRCRIRSQQAENRPLGGMPQAPGRLAQPEAKVRELNGSQASSASGKQLPLPHKAARVVNWGWWRSTT